MNLSEIALEKINVTPIRLKLALRLGLTERSVQDLIKFNKDENTLTKAAAIKLIREETGLTDDEILNEEPSLTIKS